MGGSRRVAGLVALALSLTLLGDGARAQANGNPAVRGANLARMTAEKLNGGLGAYRTAACMHAQAGGDCLVRRTSEGLLFRFSGGPPGWQPMGQPATVDTEILVAPDGRSVKEVIYNGPPRQPGS